MVVLQDAKDPDELIRKSPSAWQKAIAETRYAVDWLIDRYAAALDLKTAPGKKAFTDTLLSVIDRLSDPVEQDHYLNQLATLTDSSVEAVKAKFSTHKTEAAPLRKLKVQPPVAEPLTVEYRRLQDHFLALTLMQPKTRIHMTDCREEYFNEGEPRTVFNFLRSHPTFRGEPQLAKELQQISDYVKILTLQFEELYQDLPLDDLSAQAQALKRRLIAHYVKIQKQQLVKNMQETTDEKKWRQLILQADKLTKLVSSK